MKGALAPYTRCVLSNINQVKLIEQPTYQRAMLSLQSNLLDLGLYLVRTAERDKQAYYAGDLITTRTILIKKKRGASDRQSQITGTRLGTYFISQLEALDIEVGVKVQSFEQLISMFNLGRVDAMVEAEIFLFDNYHRINGYPDEVDQQVLSEVVGGGYFSFKYKQGDRGLAHIWQQQVAACIPLLPLSKP